MSAASNDLALAQFEALFGPEFGHGKSFDLACLRTALAALGDPHEKLPPVIHIAGTNGKGSTLAFLRAIAEAAGLSVHAFTKPHLLALRERFRVAGALVSDQALIDAATRVRRIAPDLTQFEAQVAAAFVLFAEAPADLVLLETGMGGRDDATNVITRPAATLLTPIALDHQDALGAALAEIAAHKVGIIKPGAPAIVARQADAAREIIEAHAAHIGAPLFMQGEAWDAYAAHGRLTVQTETRALDLPLPALLGAHQIDNAGLAAATFLLTRLAPISDDAFEEGMQNANWPGRLQPLTRGPLVRLAPYAEIWVDGGHNAHAAEMLAREVQRMDAHRAAPLVLLIGMRARKDWSAFVETLAPRAAHVIALPLGDCGAPPEEIAQAARARGVSAETAPSLEAAIEKAAQLPAPRILICGSLLLAAQALQGTTID